MRKIEKRSSETYGNSDIWRAVKDTERASKEREKEDGFTVPQLLYVSYTLKFLMKLVTVSE